MRNRFIITGLFTIAMVIFAFSSSAIEGQSLFWYRVKILEGQGTYDYQGSSEYNEKEFIEQLNRENFIMLDNLVYMDQTRKVKSFTEWDPSVKPRVYLNPKYILAVVPLTGDPRK